MSRHRSRLALIAALAVLATAACKADSRVSSFATTTRPDGSTGQLSLDGSDGSGNSSSNPDGSGQAGSGGGNDTSGPKGFAEGSAGKTSLTTQLAPAKAPVTAATRAVVTPTGVIVPLLKLNADGSAEVSTPCENTATVRNVTGLAPIDVLIDAGHGGKDSGVVGANGLREKDLNLVVGRWTVDVLNSSGPHTALLARTGDYSMTVAARSALVSAIKPKVFVSIHHNSGATADNKTPGTEVYYQTGSADSRRLAGLIYEEVINSLSIYSDISWLAQPYKGVLTRQAESGGGDYYGQLRPSAGTAAALVDMAFLSNPAEADLLAKSDVQREEGIAVARAIGRFFDTKDPGRGFVTAHPGAEAGEAHNEKEGCVDPDLQ